MQIKTTVVLSHTVRVAIIKKLFTNNKCWKVEQKEPFYTIGGNANWDNHCGEQCGDLKKKKRTKTMTQPIPLLEYTPLEETKTEKDAAHPSVHHSIVYNSLDMEVNQMSISRRIDKVRSSYTQWNIISYKKECHWVSSRGGWVCEPIIMCEVNLKEKDKGSTVTCVHGI